MVLARMAGDELIQVINLHHARAGLYFQLLANQWVRHRVEVLVVLDVVVYSHPDFLDVNVLVAMFRQRTQHRFIQRLREQSLSFKRFKLAVTTPRQFLERLVIELPQ